MASVTAIGSEVIGECVEEIRIEVGRKILRMVLVCPGFSSEALSAFMGLSSGYVDGDGARYWRLICWLAVVTGEIKKPLLRQGLWRLT
jgi:hypothetical protein